MSNAHESPTTPGPQPEPLRASETTAQQSASEPEEAAAAPARKTQESRAAHAAQLDRILAVTALVFAFFLASFPARNADLWMDLAAGRLIAQGQYHFGADPFAFTTPRTGWVWINHAWLYDWIMYLVSGALRGVENSAGGAGLVALKALLITGMAGFLLLIRRGRSLWIAAACTALAVLVTSPWLELRPVCVSLLFLAATLFLLLRSRTESRPLRGGLLDGLPRHLLLLPVVFALWVNLDGWFLLGPVTVALFLVGEYLELRLTRGFPGADAPQPGELRGLAIILALGLGACLLSPYHVHGFTLPSDLWTWLAGGPFKTESFFQKDVHAPFSAASLKEIRNFSNAAGLGYFALAVLGPISFFLNRSRLRFSWLLLWLVFFFLGLGLAPAIPLFAVVGAAVASLNCQEWTARRFAALERAEGRGRKWTVAGRYLGLLVGIVLLALAWPGWLHPNSEDPHQTHRVAWEVEVNPSFRQAAARINELYDRKVLREGDHGFNFTPELADYFAWFCPREQGFLDGRYPLFAGVGGPFLEVRKAFHPKSVEPGREAAWQSVFRDPNHPINHVILTGREPREVLAVFLRFWDDPDQWTLLYADGRTFILGWSDPRKRAQENPAFRSQEVDFNVLAYGPEVPAEDKAPERGPELPPARTLWDLYVKGPVATPLAKDESALYQQMNSHISQSPLAYRVLRYAATLATPPAVAPAGGGAASFAQAVENLHRVPDAVVLSNFAVHRLQIDPGALSLLGVRAARRAVVANPEDGDSFRQLGMSYQNLWQVHESPRVGDQFGNLQQLRQIQALTAYQRSLRLQLDKFVTHKLLADAFERMYLSSFLPTDPRLPAFNFTDFELDHRQKYLDGLRAKGPQSGQAPEDFERRVQEAEKMIQKREQETQFERRKREYEKAAADWPPLEKAQLALQLGLIKEAIDMLLQADRSQVGGDEIYALLILTGQAHDVPEPEKLADPRIRFLYAGATGQYSLMDQYLEQLVLNHKEDPQSSATGNLTRMLQRLTFQGAGDPRILFGIIQSAQAPLEWADLTAFRGILALETGDTIKAAGHFRAALELNAHPLRLAAIFTPLGGISPLENAVLNAGLIQQARQRPLRFGTEPLVTHYWLMMREIKERMKDEG